MAPVSFLEEIRVEAEWLALHRVDVLIEAGATPRQALAMYRELLNERIDEIYA